MIYRVQREPTMASFWTAADQPTSQPFVPLSAAPLRAFSPSFTLFLLPRPLPPCPCRAINLSRWCGIQPSAATACGTAHPGAAKLVGVDRWSRCHHRPDTAGTLRRIYAVHPGRYRVERVFCLKKTGIREDVWCT